MHMAGRAFDTHLRAALADARRALKGVDRAIADHNNETKSIVLQRQKELDRLIQQDRTPLESRIKDLEHELSRRGARHPLIQRALPSPRNPKGESSHESRYRAELERHRLWVDKVAVTLLFYPRITEHELRVRMIGAGAFINEDTVSPSLQKLKKRGEADVKDHRWFLTRDRKEWPGVSNLGRATM
jgi:hypothetical protein